MDTIVAIATAPGIGGIGIVRMSGKDCFSILENIFVPKHKENIEQIKVYTMKYGQIISKETGTVIDEVLVSYFKEPKSYTTENMCEINSHGGMIVLQKILEECLKNGAVLAEPGEFTKRAFLNGRIDLIEAEAVSDIINAQTENSRSLAINQLTGELSRIIQNLRQEILSLMANIEVNIDFPEYEDAEEITHNVLKPKLKDIKAKLLEILNESNNSKIIKEGIDVAIIGRPNVGKSSILNSLLEENKAIVTNIAGTTRDIVEGSLILAGIKINFIDTAGIRKTEDLVEKIGVDKSLATIDKADLVILVLNNNEKLLPEDQELLTKIKKKKHIIFVNKCDLSSTLTLSEDIKNKIIRGNTIEPNGLNDLKKAIVEMFNLESFSQKDLTYLSNARQISLVKRAIKIIDEVEEQLNNEVPIDFLTVDIKNCWDLLGEIIGATYKDELIDELFSKFCLGK